MKKHLLFCFLLSFSITTIHAQWSNRYPKVDGFGHHVYLEGYELPILNSGPTNPAPSPNKSDVVFAAKGWLWLMKIGSSKAERITFSPDMDSKPNWSPDGNQIVFVRDNSVDTKIVLLDLISSKEITLIDSQALDFRPNILSRWQNTFTTHLQKMAPSIFGV